MELRPQEAGITAALQRAGIPAMHEWISRPRLPLAGSIDTSSAKVDYPSMHRIPPIPTLRQRAGLLASGG